MSAERDPRIGPIAKLLFTGPLFQFNDGDWDEATSYAMSRRQCLMAAEDVLRGIDEAARGAAPNSDDPLMPPETLMERMAADGRLWKLGVAAGKAEALGEPLPKPPAT